MPAQPTWFHRLDEIVCELRALGTDYLDRQAVERIFGVRERRARQIMGGLPCLPVGNAVAVSRSALIERLEATKVGDRFQWKLQGVHASRSRSKHCAIISPLARSKFLLQRMHGIGCSIICPLRSKYVPVNSASASPVPRISLRSYSNCHKLWPTIGTDSLHSSSENAL